MLTNLEQSKEELKSNFLSSDVDSLTDLMNNLEVVINREQKYINKFLDENDANPDDPWNQYKINASDNVIVLDCMKVARDMIKQNK